MKIAKTPLTARQQEVYDAICQLLAKNKFSPTGREIHDALGKKWEVKSVGAVWAAIIGIQAKGWLEMPRSSKVRTLKLK
ncbi:MAG: hypothetical protein WCH62_05200 [Candidatus Omnitrophota bacterium]